MLAQPGRRPAQPDRLPVEAEDAGRMAEGDAELGVDAVLPGFPGGQLGVPGDVLSGALSGTVLAELSRWVIDKGED